MKRFFRLIAIFSLLPVVCATSLCAQTNPPVSSLEELRTRLGSHVAQAKFDPGIFGVKIIALQSGKIVFEHDAGKLFSPASNCKLYTVALALDELGGDYRIKTSLFAAEKPNRFGTLKGDLIVYGRGDPTINERMHGTNIFEALEPLVAVLTNAGVKRISGDLVGDESFFRGPPYGSGWDCDDLEYYYGAEISALTINDNLLKLTAKPGAKIGDPCSLSLTPATSCLALVNRTRTAAPDARRDITCYRPLGENAVYVSGQWPLGDVSHNDYVTFHNPAALFAAFFKEALARHGIKVGGRLRTMSWLDRQAQPLDWAKMTELGFVESPPLREIAREILKPSQNLYTDLLLAHVGALAAATNSTAGGTSEEAGVARLRLFLAKAGVRENDLFFEEGSGLSRNNLATPNATVALLQFMARHAAARAYEDALPVAGVDGSLRNRLKGARTTGNVHAKTGTLRWANSLSGYVTTAAGERLAFCIMLNRFPAPAGDSATAEIDFIPRLLAEFGGKIDP